MGVDKDKAKYHEEKEKKRLKDNLLWIPYFIQ